MKNLKIYLLLLILSFLSACATLPTDYLVQPSYAVSNTDNTALGREASKILANNKSGSTVYLLNEGPAAFYARMLLLREAERSIDVQYFIWHADLIGKLLFNEIILAADRGVRVRMLIDDLNTDHELEAILYALDQHENINVRLYNPFASRSSRLSGFITDTTRVDHRMHNKTLTVDNQVTIVGGRNIGDEYFTASLENNFVDIDVLSVGPVVDKIEKQFDIYWNYKMAYPVKAFYNNNANVSDMEKLKKQLADFMQSNQESKYALDIKDTVIYRHWHDASARLTSNKIYSGNLDVIYDDPEKSQGKSDKEVVYLKSLMLPYLENVTTKFEFVSPYFVPGESGAQYLTNMVKQGKKVRAVTNSLSSTDGVMAQSGYAKHRIDLLKGGVELYELKTTVKRKSRHVLKRSAKATSGLHAKTYIFDRQKIFIGSFNFDQRSENINTEVGIIYLIPELAQHIASSVFDTALKEDTYRVELTTVIEKDEDDEDVEVDSVVWIEAKDNKEYRYTTEPNTSGWRRFTEDFFTILPIEKEL